MKRGVKRAAAAVAVALVASAVAAPKKADVDARRPDGSTPLQWAAFEGDVAQATRLLKAGADVKAVNNYGISPLLLAADISSTGLIQLFLKAGADPNSANPENETALHLVARSGNVEAATILLKAGAKVDPRENFGRQTPLMWAVARRQPAMVEFLLDNGADVNARSAVRDYQRVATAESRAKQMDRGGFTPLMYAARENCRECVEILLKHHVDVNLPDPSGVSPLVIAMINNNWDIAKRLVEAGADVNQWDIFGQSPLAVAIGDMNGGGGRGANPLDADNPQKATGRELVQMLIDRGANPNQQTYFRPARGAGGGGRGTTPFMVAVSTGNIDLVKELLQKGANPKLATSEGQGAIIMAVQARGGGGFGGGGPPGGGGGFGGGGPPGGFGGGRPPGGAAPAPAPGGARGAPADDDNPDADGAAAPVAAPGAGGGPATATPARGTGSVRVPAAARAAAGRLAAAPGAGGFPGGGAAPAAAPGGASPGRGPGGPGGPGGGRGGRGAPAGGGGGGFGGGGFGGGSNTQVELIKLLADAGADVNLMAHRHFLQRSRGGSAIHFAVRSGGNRQVIKTLVDLGCDINAKDEDGLTALDYAMGRGYVPFLQMPQPPNTALADYLRSLGATVELNKTPDWPPQGPPIATAVYDAVIWPVDPVGP